MLWLLTALAVDPLPVSPAPLDPTCPLEFVELGFVGDIMMHGMQLKAARQPDGSYRVGGYEPFAPWLSSPHVTLGNLETVLAGPELRYTGYPYFNSPDSLLVAIREAGIDWLQTANNHSLDRGAAGALRTLEQLDAAGFPHVGSYATAQDRAFPWVMEQVGSVRVAWLAYTYGTNNVPLPPDQPWLISLLDRGLMEREIALAREHADLVVVGLHWGEEYRHYPEPWQEELAASLVRAGADILHGHHPHVLQPARGIRVADGRDGLIFYSLGNFVSNQRRINRDGGMFARVTVGKCRDQTWLHDVRFTPFWVDAHADDGRGVYRVLPLTTCVQADVSRRDCEKMRRFWAHAAEIFPEEQLDSEVEQRWVSLP